MPLGLRPFMHRSHRDQPSPSTTPPPLPANANTLTHSTSITLALAGLTGGVDQASHLRASKYSASTTSLSQQSSVLQSSATAVPSSPISSRNKAASATSESAAAVTPQAHVGHGSSREAASAVASRAPSTAASSPELQPQARPSAIAHAMSLQNSSQPPPLASATRDSSNHQVDLDQVRKALEATDLHRRESRESRERRTDQRSGSNSGLASALVSRSNSKNAASRGSGGNGYESALQSGVVTPASRASSVHNDGGDARRTAQSSTSQNPTASANAPASSAKLSRESSTKGKMASRISRMFQQSSKAVHKDLEAVKDFVENPPDGTSSGTSAPVASAARDSHAPTATASHTPLRTSAAASDRDSRDGDKTKDRDKDKKLDPKAKAAKDALNRRFEVHADGTHSHHLKAAKRQEKLSDMWRDMFGAGKKKDDATDKLQFADDQQLSLMSSWVEQLKSEKENNSSLASSKKDAASTSASLVDKYGKCQEVVGRGAFGIVRISHKTDPKDHKTERLFAVKEFKRRPQETAKKYQKRLTSEFCISSSLRHPNIIHTLDLMPDAKGDYCAVMEYCAGGDLYTLILAAGKLDVGEADCFFKQIMRGVEYMHEMGVAHRDLKPENLLLTTHGAVKITDFGNGECFRMAWEKEAHMTAGLCGSAPYIAPEEYVNKEFDPRAVDVWATGVIYMAMRTGRHLWRVAQKDEDEFYQKYLQGRRDEDGYAPIETLHRARCRNVIYSILDPNPTRRITATQVLKSEWLRDVRVCKAGQEGF